MNAPIDIIHAEDTETSLADLYAGFQFNYELMLRGQHPLQPTEWRKESFSRTQLKLIEAHEKAHREARA